MTDTTRYAQRVREAIMRVLAKDAIGALYYEKEGEQIVQMQAEAIAEAMCTEWDADHINQYLIDNGYKKEI